MLLSISNAQFCWFFPIATPCPHVGPLLWTIDISNSTLNVFVLLFDVTEMNATFSYGLAVICEQTNSWLKPYLNMLRNFSGERSQFYYLFFISSFQLSTLLF